MPSTDPTLGAPSDGSLLEDEVLAVVANLVPDGDEDGEGAAKHAWTEALAQIQPGVILKREEERALRRVTMPGSGAIKTLASHRAALLETVQCLTGYALPSSWGAKCKAHNLCPVHLMMPGMCPFGQAACPMRHQAQEEREDSIAVMVGARNPTVYAAMSTTRTAASAARRPCWRHSLGGRQLWRRSSSGRHGHGW